MEFASDKELLTPISNYLGTFPVIGNIRIIETISNDNKKDSQLFHLDPEDYKQVKVFINLSNINYENGPLTVLKASKSKQILDQIKDPFSRVSDNSIYGLTNDNDFLECTSPVGTAFVVDTCSCFHMGSRTRIGNRIILLITYLRFPGIVEPGRTSNIDFKNLNINLPDHEYSNKLFKFLRPRYLKI